MKMKLKNFLAIVVTLIGLSYFTSDVSANTITSNDELISQLKVFDENGNQISYTIDELKGMFKLVPNSSIMQTRSIATFSSNKIANYFYKSTPFSFTKNVSLDGGRTFYRPVDLQITPTGTAKAFSLFVDNTSLSTEARRIDFPSGWSGTVHMSLKDLSRSYGYKFTFRNYAYNTTVYMDNATLYYD